MTQIEKVKQIQATKTLLLRYAQKTKKAFRQLTSFQNEISSKIFQPIKFRRPSVTSFRIIEQKNCIQVHLTRVVDDMAVQDL